MGDRTKIEWADATWNPVTGCTPASEGCANCYAKRLTARFPVLHRGEPFNSAFVLHEKRLDQPLRWQRPRRIFVCSLGDIFHERVNTRWLDRVLEVMAACNGQDGRPYHEFMLLTKRPENINRMLYDVTVDNGCRDLGGGDVLPNVWIGITAENQQRLNERMPHLLAVRGFRKFISIEPMLGPMDLEDVVDVGDGSCEDHISALHCDVDPADDIYGGATIEWVIVGGETGPGRRPFKMEWAHDVAAQCYANRVPFLFKSDGATKYGPVPPGLRRDFPPFGFDYINSGGGQ